MLNDIFFLSYKMINTGQNKHTYIYIHAVQSAGAVEYTNYISAEK